MTATKSRKSAKRQPCVCAAGRGERDTEDVSCKLRDGMNGRNATRALWDDNGRWLVQWREANGEEWVGTYRLIPC